MVCHGHRSVRYGSSYGRLWGTALTAAALSASCIGSDPFVGRLEDQSYSGWRHESAGRNANGDAVRFEQFDGRFVWVDISAPWCGPCLAQAPVMRKLEKKTGGDLVVLTVIATNDENSGDPTVETARDWSRRFRLDPARVVARGMYVGPVPHHFLFSPKGQTLYRRAGLHSLDQIERTLSEQMRLWSRWQAGDGAAAR